MAAGSRLFTSGVTGGGSGPRVGVVEVGAHGGGAAHVWYERGAESSLPVEAHAGVLDLDDVKLPDDAGYYLCGPLPFMQAVRSGLIDRGAFSRGNVTAHGAVDSPP